MEHDNVQVEGKGMKDVSFGKIHKFIWLLVCLTSCAAGYFVLTEVYSLLDGWGWLFDPEATTKNWLTWILYFLMGTTFLGVFTQSLKMGSLPPGGLLIMVLLSWLMINIPTIIAYFLIRNDVNYLGWVGFMIVSLFAVIFTISLTFYFMSGFLGLFLVKKKKEVYARGPLGSSINESNSEVIFKKTIDIEDVEIKREEYKSEDSVK